MAITELPAPISREEMKKNEVPIPFRDRCAGLLIPLNKCRKEGWYLPWTCVEERHDYEHCQYLDFKRRVKELEELKKARDAAAKASRAGTSIDDDDDDF